MASNNEDIAVSVLAPHEGHVYARTVTGTENYVVPREWNHADGFVTIACTGAPITFQFGNRRDMQPIASTDSDLLGLVLSAKTSTAFTLEPGQIHRFRPVKGKKLTGWFFAVTSVGGRWMAWRSSHPLPLRLITPDDLPELERFLADAGLVGAPAITSWTAVNATALSAVGSPQRVVDVINALDGVDFDNVATTALTGAFAYGAQAEARAFTMLAVIIRTNNNQGDQGIAVYDDTSGQSVVKLHISNRRLSATRTGPSGSDTLTAPQELPLDTGVMVSLVVEADRMLLYTNDQLVSQVTLTDDPINLDTLTLGNSEAAEGADDRLRGTMLEHVAFDDSLSPGAIKGLYLFYVNRFGVGL